MKKLTIPVHETQVQLKEVVTPGAAPPGYVYLYPKADGKLYSRDDTRAEYPIQPGLHGNTIMFISNSAGAAAPNVIGGTITASPTISSVQTIASANPWLATFHRRFTSAATAGSLTGMRTAYTQWFRGSATGFGGFYFSAELGHGTNLNGAQAFVGLCASTVGLATTAGSVAALLTMIGMGYDTTDANTGNWFLYRNDGTGTATKVDLGTSAARANTTHGYDLTIYCPPGASTQIYVKIVNIHTGTTILDTNYTTGLPAVNTGMAFKAESNNGAVAASSVLDVGKVYIETDY